jgi:hypothetical protein
MIGQFERIASSGPLHKAGGIDCHKQFAPFSEWCALAITLIASGEHS